MAATDGFGAVGSELVSKVFSNVLIFGGALLVIGILVGVGYYMFMYRRKFDIIVKIVSERSGDRNRIIFDKAAILTDRKTKAK